MPTVAAVIVAAGSGRRMETEGVPKQYLQLGGEPVLARAIRAFTEHARVDGVVVVIPQAEYAEPPRWLSDLPVTLVPGGPERGDSVWNGLQVVREAVEIVLIHDGARPLITARLIDSVIDAAAGGAALAAIPVSDTLKLVSEAGWVEQTPDRSRYWQAQTPQGFSHSLILDVYRRAREEGIRRTDDAALCEHYGVPVRVVEGAHSNIKITRPLDLRIAEILVQDSRSAGPAAPSADRP